MAAETYKVPPAALIGILSVENGRIGQAVMNTNGTEDLGPMQINTLWMPTLSKKWNVSEDKAKEWVRDDACTNISVGAWILSSHYRETGSLSTAIQYYHSRTPKYGNRYRKKVTEALESKGLIR